MTATNPPIFNRNSTLWTHRLVGVTLALLVLATGAAAALRALPFGAAVNASWLNGAAAREFENHYKADFPATDFGTALWTAIEFRLFGTGRPGVVIGRDGWLFSEEEFRAWPQAEARLQQRLALIEAVDQRLWVQGVDLILAPLPAKARIYPDKLGERQPDLSQRLLYERLLTEMRRRHVNHVDLFGALLACSHEEPSFLRTDTHWTPQGAQCAARMIAAQAQRLSHPAAYSTEQLPVRAHQGDLLKYLPMAPWFSQWMPEPDRYRPLQSRAAGSGDLLGDAPLPDTVLICTSYSEDRRWNFEGALSQALGEPVLNFAERGVGPYLPMLRWLQALEQGTAASGVPRQVIWELPERYLLAPERIASSRLAD